LVQDHFYRNIYLCTRKSSKKSDTKKPGITGWAQVNWRNSWNKKFEYDVWYVTECSFVLDIKIVLMTLEKGFYQRKVLVKRACLTMEILKELTIYKMEKIK
jgi:lipopolysaccharide/colanic/teichoic acid biosynthesis glycosyltransferase